MRFFANLVLCRMLRTSNRILLAGITPQRFCIKFFRQVSFKFLNDFQIGNCHLLTV